MLYVFIHIAIFCLSLHTQQVGTSHVTFHVVRDMLQIFRPFLIKLHSDIYLAGPTVLCHIMGFLECR